MPVTYLGYLTEANLTQDNKAKIVNPDRVGRILQRIVDARMIGLIRVDPATSVAIKARFNALEIGGGKTHLHLEGISEKGLKALTLDGVVQIEVLGMSTKIIFLTRVARIISGGILAVMPSSLLSVERRANARSLTTPQSPAFIKLGQWKPQVRDLSGPPMFAEFSDISAWCAVSDISAGGASIVTRFPAVLESLIYERIDSEAELILPGQHPFKIKMEPRWSKRTKERIKFEGIEQYQLKFSFGLRFTEVNELAEGAIKHFLKELSMADAI